MNPHFLCFVLLGLAGCSLPRDVSVQPTDASILVDATRVVAPVNPLIFGYSIEAADSFGVYSNIHRPSGGGQGFWNPNSKQFIEPAIAEAEALHVGALRYPGGSLANNFDWRATVGPVADRPLYQFGIDEFIALCRRLHAEPVFTVSDYALPVGEMPANASGLVEYLNAPAIPRYPWAMKRAEWGHTDPYGVKWFELGNESDGGNHHGKVTVTPFRRYTPEQYVDYVRACAAAMRAIDPTIKIGVVTVPGDARDIDNAWNRAVFRDAVPLADYVILHFYTPSVPVGATSQAVSRAILAVGDQLGYRIAQYRAAIHQACGRDVPFAVTEYNIAAVQDKPLPFRFSFADGLFATDFMRLCLQPQTGVGLASYWQLTGGYWGAFRMVDGKMTEAATYSAFKLFAQHTGAALLSTEVETPRAEFPGFSGVNPASGSSYLPIRLLENVPLPDPLIAEERKAEKFEVNASGARSLTVRLNGQADSAFPVLFQFPAPALPPDVKVGSLNYRLTFEGRMVFDASSEADAGFGSVGLSLLDARGWKATASAVVVTGVENAKDWTPFSVNFDALPTAKAVSVLARLNIRRPVYGSMEIRNLHIDAMLPETFPAYPLLATLATKSADGRTVWLIVLNKSLDQAVTTAIQMKNFTPAAVEVSSLVAPPETITGIPETHATLPAPTNGALNYTFPACSMTAFTFTDAAGQPALK